LPPPYTNLRSTHSLVCLRRQRNQSVRSPTTNSFRVSGVDGQSHSSAGRTSIGQAFHCRISPNQPTLSNLLKWGDDKLLEAPPAFRYPSPSKIAAIYFYRDERVLVLILFPPIRPRQIVAVATRWVVTTATRSPCGALTTQGRTNEVEARSVSWRRDAMQLATVLPRR